MGPNPIHRQNGFSSQIDEHAAHGSAGDEVAYGAITRDEVSHLARLFRLALGDDELDHLAAQLDQIISAVARVQEVAAEDIPPTSHALPLTNVYRTDEVRECLTPEQACPVRLPPRSSASRPADPGRGGLMELVKKGAAELGLLAAGEVSAVEVAQAHLDRIAAVDGQVNAFLHVDGETTLAQARKVDERRAAGEELGPLA